MIINEIEIRKLIDGLAKSGKNFYNEKQFQFELAWALRTFFDSTRKNYKIHLEYRSEKNNHY